MGIGTIDSGPVSNVSMVISNVTLNGNQVPGAFFSPKRRLLEVARACPGQRDCYS
jgi:hypothetical protein